jgi:4-hydroxy-tetrahydrodipicolinate synthase
MLRYHRDGAVEQATAINQHLGESYRFESTDEYPNPVPAKAACRVLGLPVGQCRLPNPPAPGSLDDQARAVIARLGQLRQAQQSVA